MFGVKPREPSVAARENPLFSGLLRMPGPRSAPKRSDNSNRMYTDIPADLPVILPRLVMTIVAVRLQAATTSTPTTNHGSQNCQSPLLQRYHPRIHPYRRSRS